MPTYKIVIQSCEYARQAILDWEVRQLTIEKYLDKHILSFDFGTIEDARMYEKVINCVVSYYFGKHRLGYLCRSSRRGWGIAISK